ncbi:Sodium/glucose cotransporter [Planctomycetes bacterium MalM25]|nr:Sodium/glucose cotransporter [Planctomycetes bacterium MalM25]
MGIIDIAVFIGFVVAVVGIGLFMSREEDNEKDASDYFLAGRGLTWWLVGFSLIAANISTEQFVGMSGQAADWLGMAIASYEWMAAITLVVVAFVFLPTFLKSGIYTIPEFLEYRYNTFARTVMAIVTLIILVGVPTASVIYSGAKVISVGFADTTLLGLDLSNITVGCWIIGLLAAAYVFAGGLKACAWADLIQGAALIIGGVVVTYLAMTALEQADPAELVKTAASDTLEASDLEGANAWDRFWKLNDAPLPEGKVHMVRPADDPKIPWTALVVGLWIPNFFYWGLNQYITQRTLGSKSLAEGQRGVVFAAFLKLIIPFVVVIPGILAYNLYSGDLSESAERKNSAVLEAFEAGEKRVYDFNEQFAEQQPELVGQMIDANAALLGAETPDLGEGAVGLASANAGLVAAASELNSAGKAKAEVSQQLVGYDYDAAFPTLLKNLLPIGSGLKGFVYAAIFGAVVSSLASMLNSASTIATMDLYRKVRSGASQGELVGMGRIFTVVFVLIAVLIAPILDNPAFGGIFNFIQEFQGYISPGVLAIFIFGLLVPRAPRMCGTIGILLNPILYGSIAYAYPKIAFLDRMAICLGVIVGVLGLLTLLYPLKEPVQLPVNEDMDITSSPGAKIGGFVVIALTIMLYIIFW